MGGASSAFPVAEHSAGLFLRRAMPSDYRRRGLALEFCRQNEHRRFVQSCACPLAVTDKPASPVPSHFSRVTSTFTTELLQPSPQPGLGCRASHNDLPALAPSRPNRLR